MSKICVHTICLAEPFIVYAIESVINYVDKVLLYDTGSRGLDFLDYTIKDCEMLADKYPDKIVFKEIKITDETPWKTCYYDKFRSYMSGKKCKGEVRKQQVIDTDHNEFKWSMVLDGDEIWTAKAISLVKNNIIKSNTGNIQNIRVPIRWYYDTNHYFEGHGANSSTGRLFLTEKTDVLVKSPGELHLSKDTGRPFSYDDKNMMLASNLDKIFHFETYLKPWRRDIPDSALIYRKRDLPSNMRTNQYYINRYENELRSGRLEYYRNKQKQIFGA